ncbi:hypothetical protein HQ571_06745 [Candidatus Kuenenbacteria bacterium]|nr:hypothetical protein [Candidatus Kuenenbacteria bacterium]
METQTKTETKSKVKTGVATAVLGVALIAAAAAGLAIKSQDTGLKMSKGSKYDFGKVMTKETAETVFILQNTDRRTPIKFAIGDLKGAFLINKEKSTCKEELKPGKTCKVAVQFTPKEAKKYSTTMQVKFTLGKKTKVAKFKIMGVGAPSNTDIACVDSDVTDSNFAGMPLNYYKFVNVFTKGHIKGLHPSTQEFMEADDKCWNDKKILEYFCNEKTGFVSWNSYKCPGTCEDGECKDVECNSVLPNSEGLAVNGNCSWECTEPWTNEDGIEENGCECNQDTGEGCPVSQCYDSDGGINLEQMGMTQGLDPNTENPIVFTDHCSSLFQVVEGYCDGDYVAVDNQTEGAPALTSDGTTCPSGTACIDSACKPCVWKDLGYTTCQEIGGKYYESDMSLTPDCEVSATNSNTGIKLCGSDPSSCVDGKCVQTCLDTDNGEDASTKGTVTGHWGCPEDNQPIVQEVDVCVDDFHVNEFLCNAGCDNILSTEIECPAGTSCSEGACVEVDDSNACADSDGGQDLLVKGQISWGDTQGPEDKCDIDNEFLNYDNGIIEYFCAPGSGSWHTYLYCPEGTICDDGACVNNQAASVGTLKIEFIGPEAGQLVSGSTNNEIVSYKMTAMGEAVSVQSLMLYYTGFNTSDSELKYLSEVRLYLNGNLLQDGILFTGSTKEVNFSNNNFIVQAGQSAIFSVKADISAKQFVQTSTLPIKIGIADENGSYQKWTGSSGGNYYLSAKGYSSGVDLDSSLIDNKGDGTGNLIGSNPFTVHKGILSVSLNNNSPSGTATSGAGKDLLRLDLTAVGDDIKINDMEFVVDGTCNPTGTTGTYLRSSDLSTTYAEWLSDVSLNGQFPQDWSFSGDEEDNTWNSELMISQGTTKTVRLTGDTTGCSTNEVLSVSIMDSESNDATQSGIEYEDSSGVDIDLITTKSLPVYGSTLVY